MIKAEQIDRLKKLRDCPDNTEIILAPTTNDGEYRYTDDVEVAYIQDTESGYIDAVWDEDAYNEMEDDEFKRSLKKVIVICER